MYVLGDVFIPCVNFEFVLVGQDGLRGLYAGISPNLGKPNSVNETSSSKRFCHHKTISFNVIAMHCRTFLWAINAWTIKKKRISRSVSFYLRWKPNAKEKKREECKKNEAFPLFRRFWSSILLFSFHFSFFSLALCFHLGSSLQSVRGPPGDSTSSSTTLASRFYRVVTQSSSFLPLPTSPLLPW